MFLTGIGHLKYCYGHMYTRQKLVSVPNISIKEVFLHCIGPFVNNVYFFCVTDMWAMGAILAELLSLRPLFPGARYLALQFSLIKQCCGCDVKLPKPLFLCMQ